MLINPKVIYHQFQPKVQEFNPRSNYYLTKNVRVKLKICKICAITYNPTYVLGRY